MSRVLDSHDNDQIVRASLSISWSTLVKPDVSQSLSILGITAFNIALSRSPPFRAPSLTSNVAEAKRGKGRKRIG